MKNPIRTDGVEIDEGDVFGLFERPDELHDRVARLAQVALHAEAAVERQAQVQRQRIARRALREVRHLLRAPVLEHFEVLGRQPAHQLAVAPGDNHRQVDEVDAGAKLLLRQRWRRQRRGQPESRQPHSKIEHFFVW